MAESCGSGHLGGSFSVMDALVALYFQAAKNDPKNPGWEDRDRIILSKAHCCEALYAVLGERGYFDKSLFKTFGEWGSVLQGHAECCTPGVEFSGGSLGQGLSFAVGKALAGKMQGKNYRIYCILGDGECNEGQVWEAAMSAAQYKLDNLIVIVDYNKHSSEPEPLSEVMDVAVLENKWLAFNWFVHTVIDGNDIDELLVSMQNCSNPSKGIPNCIIAHTTKGKGVPLWEEKSPHLVYGEMLRKGIEEWRTN
mgnify:CR=1 FL=1